RAYNGSVAAERRVAQVAAYRNQLAGRYDVELRRIDQLKKQRASWRRDRELRDQLSASLETANQLKAATVELKRANDQLVAARRALVAAIDREVSLGPTPPRRAQLAKARAAVAPAGGRTPNRIVLPDTKIDPLADPEELDLQAAALRDTEAELARQVTGLEVQAKELERIVAVRKQHDRASEIARREDDTPRRGSTPNGNGKTLGISDGAEDSSPAPSADPGGRGDAVTTFESDATVVLAEVVDPSTIDSLHRASRSGDPAQRALAAKKARDAVAARLEQLRQKRAQIEARARQLRK
ncbi:MAG TPA: hypothetical protein VIU61_20350, partial [Kofleriaceae bacterium]